MWVLYEIIGADVKPYYNSPYNQHDKMPLVNFLTLILIRLRLVKIILGQTLILRIMTLRDLTIIHFWMYCLQYLRTL